MKLDQAFPGNWLKTSDLGEEDHVVTIDTVKREMIGQGEQAKLKLVIRFHEFAKPLVCNLTNAKNIAKVLGSDDTDDWEGERITLWVNPDVSFGGEVVEAIRVRSKAPTQPQQAQRQTASRNGALSYPQAVKLVTDAGASEADLKDYLKSCGVTSWNPRTAQQCSDLAKQFAAGIGGPPPSDGNDDIPFAHPFASENAIMGWTRNDLSGRRVL